MEASALTTASHSGLLARRSPLLRLQGDERLVALIRDGHDRAFEVLFDRYQVRLLAFCRQLLNSKQDAEDVLQEVFVAAHVAMLADDRPIKARPWLYRIARNRCLNHLRRPVAEGEDSMDVHPHQNGATTHEQVQQREDLRAIVADVHELPETQRTALVLREIDDLCYTEIAQAMGTTLPAVKSLLVRARMSLAEASEARILTCDEVRLELAEAAEGLCKASGPARRHVRDCDRCRRYRSQLRSTTRALGGLAPLGLLSLLQRLFGAKLGGGSAGGGSAGTAGGATGTAGGATGTAGGVTGTAGGAAAAAGGSGASLGGAAAAAGGAASGIGGALGTKAAVGMATAALFTAGAVGVNDLRNKGAGESSYSSLNSTPSIVESPAVHAGTRHHGHLAVSAAKVAQPTDPAPAPAPAEPAPAPAPTTEAETAPEAAPAEEAPATTSGEDTATSSDEGWDAASDDGSAEGSSADGEVGADPTPPPPEPVAEPEPVIEPAPSTPPADSTQPPPDPAPPPAQGA